ncbi:hypothetical protein niasHT_025540 [Heterodera trifolii]|uniref:Uncharacterized protein n=1 Tax=Heterodera trifolii TaxID=157864 RepID=A0ABD2J8R6_9BILA
MGPDTHLEKLQNNDTPAGDGCENVLLGPHRWKCAKRGGGGGEEAERAVNIRGNGGGGWVARSPRRGYHRPTTDPPRMTDGCSRNALLKRRRSRVSKRRGTGGGWGEKVDEDGRVESSLEKGERKVNRGGRGMGRAKHRGGEGDDSGRMASAPCQPNKIGVGKREMRGHAGGRVQGLAKT